MALGSILAGVAPNINTVIIGRVITGIGSAGAFMTCVTNNTAGGFFFPTEADLVAVAVSTFYFSQLPPNMPNTWVSWELPGQLVLCSGQL